MSNNAEVVAHKCFGSVGFVELWEEIFANGSRAYEVMTFDGNATSILKLKTVSQDKARSLFWNYALSVKA